MARYYDSADDGPAGLTIRRRSWRGLVQVRARRTRVAQPAGSGGPNGRGRERFHADDSVFAIGVCLLALVRVTHLCCGIDTHTGAITVADAARLSGQDSGSGADHESGTFLQDTRRRTCDASTAISRLLTA